MDELEQTQNVVFDVDIGGEETQYKIVFCKVTSYRKALFDRYQRRIQAALANEFLQSIDATDTNLPDNENQRYWAVKALLDPFDAELMETKNTAALLHAIILASTAHTAKLDGEKWTKCKLPDSWYDPVQAVEYVPSDLANTLLLAVVKLTPLNVFGFSPTDEDEKKVLRLVVAPSVN